ncbi:hypothetical protein BKG82_27255 [Mycobacteroides chelonae]|uniref:Uncharacterized protein n=1 Tax=Mycobacteroides chelonae TaxID=1774 RepID=A0A1S1LGE2_MYCCH|nr:hypothetical protein [Mycobacteroides chelonae]OHU47351.1 hypothetical protein BKG82_27255 [Mycobacteroides chelonae]
MPEQIPPSWGFLGLDMPLIKPLDIDPETATDAEREAARLTELAIECELRARHCASTPTWLREAMAAMNAASRMAPQGPLDGTLGGAAITYQREEDQDPR